jgi:hypothetical protein
VEESHRKATFPGLGEGVGKVRAVAIGETEEEEDLGGKLDGETSNGIKNGTELA